MKGVHTERGEIAVACAAACPVAVGGVGGSGTRLIAQVLLELGYYLGGDLNESLDNLWFTLLFKRREVLDLTEAAVRRGARGLRVAHDGGRSARTAAGGRWSDAWPRPTGGSTRPRGCAHGPRPCSPGRRHPNWGPGGGRSRIPTSSSTVWLTDCQGYATSTWSATGWTWPTVPIRTSSASGGSSFLGRVWRSRRAPHSSTGTGCTGGCSTCARRWASVSCCSTLTGSAPTPARGCASWSISWACGVAKDKLERLVRASAGTRVHRAVQAAWPGLLRSGRRRLRRAARVRHPAGLTRCVTWGHRISFVSRRVVVYCEALASPYARGGLPPRPDPDEDP